MNEMPAEGGLCLAFSGKYDESHSHHYLAKHQATLASRLSHWRDMQVARKLLSVAGDPGLVLDLPCGAGRFWPMLAERPGRVIIGADNSANMLEVAMRAQPQDVVSRVRPLQTSVFDIKLPDNAVDSILCMRLLHHIGEHGHRACMLRELNRVTRDTVIISLWVDGNYKAWRRRKLEARRAAAGKETGYQNRFVLPAAQAEEEFAQAGFSVVEKTDFLPFYAMWRFYVLRKNA